MDNLKKAIEEMSADVKRMDKYFKNPLEDIKKWREETYRMLNDRKVSTEKALRSVDAPLLNSK